MTQVETNYNYELFADTDEYRTVNTDIIRGWVDAMVQKGTREVDRLLDIATGLGTMVQLFLENLPKQWHPPAILCLDKSKEALEQAKMKLGQQVEQLRLIHAAAEELKLPPHSVDVAVWGNGIHYLDAEGQEKALRAIHQALKKGGWFFFNSAFYAQSRPAETLPFYRSQIRHAVEYLHRHGVQKEKKEVRAQASNFLPKEHYEALLRQVGFKVEEVKEVAAHVRRSAWEHISSFQQYAAGALHGYQPEAAAEAMREAVLPALQEHGQRDDRGDLWIPRNWLAISARAV